MISRREFALTGASAVALATLHSAVQAQDKARAESTEHSMHHAQMFEACAKACSDCQRMCDSCGTHCARMLAMGNKDHLATLRTCHDCAVICAAASQVAAAGGPFATILCDACAKACAECATACGKFPDDKHMTMCADMCRQCEQACKSMVKV